MTVGQNEPRADQRPGAGTGGLRRISQAEPDTADRAVRIAGDIGRTAVFTPDPRWTAEPRRRMRLDEASKSHIVKAAELRHISISDYVRSIIVTQAEREVREAEQRIIALAPHEQLVFWNALNERTELTDAQKALGSLMRGE